MQSRKQSRKAASDRLQRLQIGGGALAVAVIWTLALWPSGDDSMERQSGPVPAVSPSPWTTGPFKGTTQTTAPGSVQSPPATSTMPAAGAATAPPTTRATSNAPGPGPAAPVAPTSSPKAPSTTSEDEWTPPGQVNKTTRPPKALSLTDLLGIS